MKQLGCGLVALGLWMTSVGVTQAEPTFIESHLTLRVEASVVPDPLQWQTADRWLTGGYADKTASATISSSNQNGVAVASASASETWESKAKGRVTFDRVEFVQAILQETGLADVNNSHWYYTFTTAHENGVEIHYATGISDTTEEIVGIEGFTVQVYQNGELIFSQDLDLETSGKIYVPLDSFQIYSVLIAPNGGFQDQSGLGISSMWGDFRWAITKRTHNPKPPFKAHAVGSTQPQTP